MYTSFYTYIEETINEWIITRVTHCKPVGTEPNDIDVLVAESKTRISLRHQLHTFFVLKLNWYINTTESYISFYQNQS